MNPELFLMILEKYELPFALLEPMFINGGSTITLSNHNIARFRYLLEIIYLTTQELEEANQLEAWFTSDFKYQYWKLLTRLTEVILSN